jgi:hypothetical protein
MTQGILDLVESNEKLVRDNGVMVAHKCTPEEIEAIPQIEHDLFRATGENNFLANLIPNITYPMGFEIDETPAEFGSGNGIKVEENLIPNPHKPLYYMNIDMHNFTRIWFKMHSPHDIQPTDKIGQAANDLKGVHLDMLWSLNSGKYQVDDMTLTRLLGDRRPAWLDYVTSKTTVNVKGIGPVEMNVEMLYKQRQGISTRFGFGQEFKFGKTNMTLSCEGCPDLSAAAAELVALFKQRRPMSSKNEFDPFGPIDYSF